MVVGFNCFIPTNVWDEGGPGKRITESSLLEIGIIIENGKNKPLKALNY